MTENTSSFNVFPVFFRGKTGDFWGARNEGRRAKGWLGGKRRKWGARGGICVGGKRKGEGRCGGFRQREEQGI